MAVFKRNFVFDKKKGRMVEVTPEGKRAVCQSLSRDARRVTKRIRRRGRQKNDVNLVVTQARWPITPEAMAVDVEDIPYAEEIARKHGVNTQYDRDTGCPIITSERHLQQHCRAFGFYKRNSYDSPVNR